MSASEWNMMASYSYTLNQKRLIQVIVVGTMFHWKVVIQKALSFLGLELIEGLIKCRGK